jgi:ribosomal protein L10
VTIVGGIFDGAFMSQSQMQEVADIPSRETLYGQIANVINSPIQGLVVSLNQVAEQRETASA